MNAYEAIPVAGRGARRHSFKNGYLCITRAAGELFPPIAQIHYLLSLHLFTSLRGPFGRPRLGLRTLVMRPGSLHSIDLILPGRSPD